MYKRITAQQAKERMEQNPKAIILDVRRKMEYDAGHIAGAMLLSNEEIDDYRTDELPDLDAEILIYCRSGNRSANAAMKLIDLGYRNVLDFGGIISWPYGVVAD